jgi:hypothetical protein
MLYRVHLAMSHNITVDGNNRDDDGQHIQNVINL